MIIIDKIYQEFEITAPVILDLLETEAFRRLERVSQFGLPDRFYHIDGFSRHTHSLGVYMLLNKLGASEEEQVAGLLHDVSHAAFSHLVDWVIGSSEKEDYQDKRHLSTLLQPELAGVLERHGYIASEIADYHRFGLLEREAPDLCADRIDYLLREVGPETARMCLPQLRAFNGEIIFSEEASALLFANKFLDCQTEHWSGYEAVTRYVIFSELLKKAIKEGVISFNDLSQTDDYVIKKIAESGGGKFTKVLDLLQNKSLDFLPKSEAHIKKKFRHVDPKVLLGGEAVRLSDLNRKFSGRLERERQLNQEGGLVGHFKI